MDKQSIENAKAGMDKKEKYYAHPPIWCEQTPEAMAEANRLQLIMEWACSLSPPGLFLRARGYAR